MIAWGIVAAVLVLGLAYEWLSRRREQGYPLPGKLMDVGGSRLHVTDRGQGPATVVIIHGAGDSSYSWMHIRNELSRFARVVTFDRPGLGSSAPGPGPDAERSVDQIRAVLAAIGVAGPVLLLGHSLGGIIARLYHARYPQQVVGLVLVDSTHEFLKDDKKFRQGFGAIGVMLKVLRVLAPFGLLRFLGQAFKVIPIFPERPYYAQQVSPDEYRQWFANVSRNFAGTGGAREFAGTFPLIDAAVAVMKPDQFGNLPVAVLSNPGYGESWIAMHKELASRSRTSIHRISDKPGHSLQMPRPDLVIDAVRFVMDQGS